MIREQDGNVPSRRHILGSKICKEQLLEKFGKKNIFFQKIIFEFFSKKVFFKSHNAQRKTQKETIQAHTTFSTNRKFQKNARGYPLINFENFRKKSHSAEKNPKGGPVTTRSRS